MHKSAHSEKVRRQRTRKMSNRPSPRCRRHFFPSGLQWKQARVPAPSAALGLREQASRTWESGHIAFHDGKTPDRHQSAGDLSERDYQTVTADSFDNFEYEPATPNLWNPIRKTKRIPRTPNENRAPGIIRVPCITAAGTTGRKHCGRKLTRPLPPRGCSTHRARSGTRHPCPADIRCTGVPRRSRRPR